MALAALLEPFRRYSNWLHTRWPAGKVEKLPEVGVDGATSFKRVRVAGDLTGVPLLKFAADSGARAVRAFLSEGDMMAVGHEGDVFDLVIVGGGVAGLSAAIEAEKSGLRYVVFEAAEPFATIGGFPVRKPIYTYPLEMVPAGGLQLKATVREDLLTELEGYRAQLGGAFRNERIDRLEVRSNFVLLHRSDGAPFRARKVIVAIGRSGDFRRLGVPGEALPKVSNRLHDPHAFAGQPVLVVGGGDSALEAAISLGEAGAEVVLSYRRTRFSRSKQENQERLDRMIAEGGSVKLRLGSRVKAIREGEVVLESEGHGSETLLNEAVFLMVGRNAPLDFFRRSGLAIQGEFRGATWAAMAAFMAFCFWLYHWKGGKGIPFFGHLSGWLNPDPAEWWRAFAMVSEPLGKILADPATLLGTLRVSASGPSFYYTLAYSLVVLIFGIRRIRFRRTPYVTVQTWTLIAVQWIPLFVLPEMLLPYLGNNGFFDFGIAGRLADSLFPEVAYGHGREYWRAYGFVLAWPLFVYNWFTSQPMVGWLIIGSIQTFVLLPLLVRRWGKGAYCGWICSCGALAETLGDRHRQKMPHGPGWNRLNLIGQVILLFAVLLLFLRILGWFFPGGWAERAFASLFASLPVVNYQWTVDLFLAGILGYGFYFWFSGRMWCRFACPLAALMHIYARFSRFRIFAEKKKCISCNACTSVCHQGIDIMDFANKGLPMEDPECVRCSACIQSCPTGVLRFGRLDRNEHSVAGFLRASDIGAEEQGQS